MSDGANIKVGPVNGTTELGRISHLVTDKVRSGLDFTIGAWPSQTFVKKEQFQWRKRSLAKLSGLFFANWTNFRDVSPSVSLWVETAKSQRCHTIWSPTSDRKCLDWGESIITYNIYLKIGTNITVWDRMVLDPLTTAFRGLSIGHPCSACCIKWT